MINWEKITNTEIKLSSLISERAIKEKLILIWKDYTKQKILILPTMLSE
jgi:hypothetical protein